MEKSIPRKELKKELPKSILHILLCTSGFVVKFWEEENQKKKKQKRFKKKTTTTRIKHIFFFLFFPDKIVGKNIYKAGNRYP